MAVERAENTVARHGEGLERRSYFGIFVASDVQSFERWERSVILVHQAQDFDTGKVKATKTGLTRKVPLEPSLVSLLESMRESGDESGNVFVDLPHRSEWAYLLREDLNAADAAKRTELTKDTETTRKLDAHDLRHTYGTWRAIRGDEVVKIQRALGHTDLATTQRYINEAQSFEGAGFGSVFAPLPVEALCPEVALTALSHIKNAGNLASPGGVGTLARRAARSTTFGAIFMSAHLWPDVKMRIAL